MSEKYEQPKTDLEKLKEQMAEMQILLELARKNEKRRLEIQATIDEFKTIQAEIETAEKARIDKETVERLKKEMEEMEKRLGGIKKD